MGYSVIQIPVANNNSQNNILSPSVQNNIINLVVPNRVWNNNNSGGNILDSLFDEDFGNGWNNWDNECDQCGASNGGPGNGSFNGNGVNTPSPFIRNFFRNIYDNGNFGNGWNDNWNDNGGSGWRGRSQAFKKKMKALLSVLLLLCALKGNNSSSF